MLLRLILLLLLARTVAAEPTGSAEGFGAQTRGGQGGRVLMVTRLDDDPRKPAKGSLRWALEQKGPRIVRFNIGGDVRLRDRIIVTEPGLTLDGSTAPEPGVCLRGGTLDFRGTQDIIVRHLRIRLGEEPAQRRRRKGADRPRDSIGLDCVTLTDCRRVRFEHCSLSWSCDELFSVVRSRDVTVQWCLLSGPLGNPRLHPYGDNHAFALNASASTLSVHHCLIHRFVMRGPQFECNDLRARDDFTVRMEAVNNVVSGYTVSGSRFVLGVEEDRGTEKGKRFEFQFLDNLYLPADADAPALEAVDKHGMHPGVQVASLGNILLPAPRRAPGLNPSPGKGGVPLPMARALEGDLQAQLPHARPLPPYGEVLFTTPVPVTRTPAVQMALEVIERAGDHTRADPVDLRARQEVLQRTRVEPLERVPER